MKRLFYFALLVIFGVIVFSILTTSSHDKPVAEDKREEAKKVEAISLIKHRFEPSGAFLALNADFDNTDWDAKRHEGCKKEFSDCWEVEAFTEVMEGADKKHVDAKWIVDLGTKRSFFYSTESRLMYDFTPAYMAEFDQKEQGKPRTDHPAQPSGANAASETAADYRSKRRYAVAPGAESAATDNDETAGSSPLPELHNSSDMECSPGPQCTEEQFAIESGKISNQWKATPEWLRKRCAVNHTFPSLEGCIMGETVLWLDTRPGEKAPWLSSSFFQSN